jgi:hypothetical protein
MKRWRDGSPKNGSGCCHHQRLLPFNFCRLCKCRSIGCQSSAVCGGLWCKKHAQQESKPGTVQNSGGIQKLNKSWSWDFKMSMKHGVWLEECCPCDVTSMLRATQQMFPGHLYLNEVLTGIDMFHLAILAVVKWPSVINALAPQLTHGKSAAEYRHILASVALSAAREDQDWMQRQIGHGRMRSVQGLVVVLKALRVLEHATPENTTALTFGKEDKKNKCTPYALTDDTSSLETTLNDFQKCQPITLP